MTHFKVIVRANSVVVHVTPAPPMYPWNSLLKSLDRQGGVDFLGYESPSSLDCQLPQWSHSSFYSSLSIVFLNSLMFKLVLKKAEEPEIKLPTSAGSCKKQEFQKNIYFCFIDYAKAFGYVDHNKLLKILREMGIPDHLTCLLRNLYAGQEATVRTGLGTTDWFQIGKGVRQGCILSPCKYLGSPLRQIRG